MADDQELKLPEGASYGTTTAVAPAEPKLPAGATYGTATAHPAASSSGVSESQMRVQAEPWEAVKNGAGFSPANIASNLWEGGKSAVKGTYELGKDLVNNPNWVEGKDSTFNKFVVQPAEREHQKAVTAPSAAESVGHSVAEAIPFVGPWAASLGEQAGKGDIGGAIGQGAGAALAMKGMSKAASAVTPRLNLTTGEAPVRPIVGSMKVSVEPPPIAEALPYVKGVVKNMPVIRQGVEAVESVKANRAAKAEKAARAADYKHASEQSELARTGGKNVPSNRDVPVSTEGRPAGFPDRLTERISPEGKSEILGPEGKPFIGERSTRVSESELAANAAKRGLSVEDYKAQLRQPKANIAQPETPAKAPETTPNIGKQWTAPSFDELSSNIKRVGRAGESKAAKANAAVSDAEGNLKAQHGGAVDSSVKDTGTSLGQFAKANGPRIDAAVPTTPEGQTLANHIHSMTGPDIAKVAEKAGVEPEYKSGKRGNKSLDREATFNKLLDAGETPESIIDRHYNRLGNPPSVSGGSGAADIGNVRQRLADPEVRAQNRIGNDLMADQHATAPRLSNRISTMNDLADPVRATSSPAEIEELDRQGQNLYRDTKGNIAKAFSEQQKPNITESQKATAAKPNIAEAPSDMKVWRDQPGEQHPVRIKYEYGQPTEVDGRHRVIEALKSGYDRIEVTVDRGNGPQKTTADVKELAKKMGVTPESLAQTDAQQTRIRAGAGKPRVAVTKPRE